ncbi:MAG TPA: hypothetical protein VM925_12630 [Labilithrix sp.]|nr:hypothetical protein [Labilithrix sp.]
MKRPSPVFFELWYCCKRAGLRIVEQPPLQWDLAFRARWQAAFGAPVAEWQRRRREWELLGGEVAAQLSRDGAIGEFNRRRAEARRAYVTPSLESGSVFEVEGKLPDHEWWQRNACGGALYIVHGDWHWSFVMTPEAQSVGRGPYFVQNATFTS